MLHIKIDDKLKEALLAEATKKGLSLNSYIRMILIEKIGE